MPALDRRRIDTTDQTGEAAAVYIDPRNPTGSGVDVLTVVTRNKTVSVCLDRVVIRELIRQLVDAI